MYHPLTLNSNSNIINAVKRQRNLGLAISLQSKGISKVAIHNAANITTHGIETEDHSIGIIVLCFHNFFSDKY
jgi:hypothetical protein